MKCVKCGRDHADYEFKVLQVQTLHVRDIGKTSRVQALGDFEEYGVCDTCRQEKYNAIVNNAAQVRMTWLIYGSLVLLGVALAYLNWNVNSVLQFTGLGLLFGGGLTLMGKLKTVNAKKIQLLMLSEEEAVEHCAWECLVDGAPKKNDINDITYIPVTEKTLERKNGDLMILYDLLPEIAIEAHKRIHAQ